MSRETSPQDRPPPWVTTDEKATLLEFLAYLREGVALKLTGLDDTQVRRAMVPSGTSLLGVVQHLENTERFWVQHLWAGRAVALRQNDFTTNRQDVRADITAAYRRTGLDVDEIVRSATSLDMLSARHWRSQRPSLRWILVHLVEETARHAGHADILRELLDGARGR